MPGPTISLITYTFNDAEFAEELIQQAQSFTVQPDEIVVVDDGSDIPFSMPDPPDNLRIIRFEENKGITRAKGAGISAAAGDFIFSMDCDTRVDADWLERALPHANVPEIGLTGGALSYRSGNDLVSRYLMHFGDNHNQSHTGAVDFIPGNAFLIRRDTWEHAGGFTAYDETNCQDHYLSHRLKRLGYTLYSDARAKAWQQRRISRTTMCNRVWKWCHKPVKMQALEVHAPEDVVQYLFGTLVAPMIDRFQDANTLGEPLFYYLELLYLAHAVFDALEYLVQRGRVNDSLRNGFHSALVDLFAGYPKAWGMLRADLFAMGHELFSFPKAGSGNSWRDFFLFSHMLREGGLLQWLDTQGVSQLIRDEMEGGFDFSSYAKASFAV
ncbi:glycosyltransferase [Pseudodesulfovibrio piezophilus]|uniref:Glycosyl transferase family 2 n=1 Tax=Pseudodesulfovibrio piezophilus (strain DSM 21447 / JCM 15486 / C1TLV30) TaxID=1322246 RepID=M1WLX6_PSEP2|nr:glycosyltransferase family 2 protein [Pseudodesulfovibrio piezophilus]CCH48625.1 Glycosyl transferase family 2 [Pseudodesulfovibrio piezophilus C1TLV30]